MIACPCVSAFSLSSSTLASNSTIGTTELPPLRVGEREGEGTAEAVGERVGEREGEGGGVACLGTSGARSLYVVVVGVAVCGEVVFGCATS